MIWELKLFWSFWGLKWIIMFHMHLDSYLNIGPRNKLKRQKSGKDSQLQITSSMTHTVIQYESCNMSHASYNSTTQEYESKKNFIKW